MTKEKRDSYILYNKTIQAIINHNIIHDTKFNTKNDLIHFAEKYAYNEYLLDKTNKPLTSVYFDVIIKTWELEYTNKNLYNHICKGMNKDYILKDIPTNPNLSKEFEEMFENAMAFNSKVLTLQEELDNALDGIKNKNSNLDKEDTNSTLSKEDVNSTLSEEDTDSTIGKGDYKSASGSTIGKGDYNSPFGSTKGDNNSTLGKEDYDPTPYNGESSTGGQEARKFKDPQDFQLEIYKPKPMPS
jgi:hypothetical protein